MADKTGEQLSALVDSECAVSEAELLLHRLAKDAELKARWQRYHLISDAIKNNIPEIIDPNFAEHISKAIAADTPPLSDPLPTLPSWYKPVTGFALAASVAVVALVGLQLSQHSEPTGGSEPLATVSPPGPRLSEPTTADSALQSRLNSYLVNHNEYASMNSVHGMLPYVRMVGYEPKR